MPRMNGVETINEPVPETCADPRAGTSEHSIR
jgi:hypothetical protein